MKGIAALAYGVGLRQGRFADGNLIFQEPLVELIRRLFVPPIDGFLLFAPTVLSSPVGVAGFSGTRKSIVILSEAALAAERRISPFGAPDGEILRRG